MREAVAIAAAEDVGPDRQLIAAELGLGGVDVGVDVDQLDHEVAVRAGRAGHQVDHRRALDPHRRGEHGGDIAQDVGPAFHEALVAHQPGAPGVGV